MEAEYMEATHTSEEAIWLMKLCLEVELCEIAIAVQCDSNNHICIAKNMIFQAKTKHMNTPYSVVRDIIEDGNVILDKFKTL